MDSSAGITELGAVPGRWAGTDPTGRYFTVVDGDTAATYDAATLTPVATHTVGQPSVVATRSDGTALAVVSADWSIQLWRAGRRAAVRETAGQHGGADRAVWLTFVAGGDYVLAGLADPDGGPVRIELLEADTLDLVDSSARLPGGYPGYDYTTELTDWGEGVMFAYAPSSAAIAFGANVGDDPHVLGVADIADGRLAVHASGFAAQVPGERLNGIALDGALYVLDSDDLITAFEWREPSPPYRLVAAGHELINDLFGEDSDYQFDGQLFVREGRLVVPLVGPELVLAVLDPTSGHITSRLNIPGPWRDGIVEDGLLRRTAKGVTWLAHWQL